MPHDRDCGTARPSRRSGSVSNCHPLARCCFWQRDYTGQTSALARPFTDRPFQVHTAFLSHPTTHRRPRVVSFGLIGTAVVDVAIAAALVWQLYGYQPTFESTRRSALP
jgi:hypothetical protein